MELRSRKIIPTTCSPARVPDYDKVAPCSDDELTIDEDPSLNNMPMEKREETQISLQMNSIQDQVCALQDAIQQMPVNSRTISSPVHESEDRNFHPMDCCTSEPPDLVEKTYTEPSMFPQALVQQNSRHVNFSEKAQQQFSVGRPARKQGVSHTASYKNALYTRPVETHNQQEDAYATQKSEGRHIYHSEYQGIHRPIPSSSAVFSQHQTLQHADRAEPQTAPQNIFRPQPSYGVTQRNTLPTLQEQHSGQWRPPLAHSHMTASQERWHHTPINHHNHGGSARNIWETSYFPGNHWENQQTFHNTGPPFWRLPPKMPIFNGRIEDWESFWVQFNVCARACSFNQDEFAAQLMMCLRGSALSYAAGLDLYTIRNAELLVKALQKRFGHITPAQTHRANLANIRKSSTESLQEYSSRIQAMMIKAYPDIEKTETFEQLSIQHFLSGYPDQELSFEVMKLSPTTLAEAVDRLTWLDSCKQQIKKKPGVRQVTFGDCMDTDDEETEVRRINGKKFVTEERLFQFQRDLNDRTNRKLDSKISEIKDAIITELKGCLLKCDSVAENRQVENFEDKNNKSICYNCGGEGHYARNCTRKKKDNQRGESDAKFTKDLETLNYRGLSLPAKSQPMM